MPPRAAAGCRVSLHTLYFWPDPAAQLAEIRRVLTPSGRVVLGFTPGEDAAARASFPDTVYRFRDTAEVERLLGAAGFAALALIRGDDAARPLAFASGLAR